MKRDKQFEIGALLCDHGCRAGLTSDNQSKCNHLNMNKLTKLAEELAIYEERQYEPSELFQVSLVFIKFNLTVSQQIAIYVDDPEFWFYVISHDKQLQRHAKPWLRRQYIETRKRQLLRLSGQQLDVKMGNIFWRGIMSIEALMCPLDDLRYFVENQQRRQVYN